MDSQMLSAPVASRGVGVVEPMDAFGLASLLYASVHAHTMACACWHNAHTKVKIAIYYY